MSSPASVASSSRIRLDAADSHLSHDDRRSQSPSVQRLRLSNDEIMRLRSTSVDIKGKGKALEEDDQESLEHAEDTDVDEEDEEEYEAERLIRIQENQRLIDSLGIVSNTTLGSSNSLGTSQNRSMAKRKGGKPRDPKDHTVKTVYDRSGYIVSLPLPGQRHRIACVEMPSDRGLRRRIAEGEYSDVVDWWEGEERRWKVGHGAALGPDEEEEVGGVTKHFRWRKWRGLLKELRKEMKARNNLNKRDKQGTETPEVRPEGVSAYSLLPGDACHQCRRKSEKLKMRCRNVDPACRAVFCETCCKRYSYFDFDPDSRSFICPLCKDCCNCANCIRKRKLDHLLGPGKVGVKRKEVEKTGITVQAWLEAAVEDKVSVPFDRVRLVDEAFDITSPDLPPEPQSEKVKATLTGKRKRTTNQSKGNRGPGEHKAKRSKKSENVVEGQDEPRSLVIKLKIPKLQEITLRTKEVDSDGDTIDGYSDDELDARSGASSALTSLLSDSRFPVPPRRAFPPRPAWMTEMNRHLANMVAQPLHADVSPAESDLGSPADGSASPAPLTAPKRRKPPPIANILRAPKHSSFSPPESFQPLPPEATARNPTLTTPITSHSSIAETWTPAPVHPVQTFSYDGYSSLPPFSLAQPQGVVHAGMDHGFPRPYSHSPPGRSTVLPLATGMAHGYTHIRSVQHIRAFGQGNLTHMAARLEQVANDGSAVEDGRIQRKDLWMGDNGLTQQRMYHPSRP